MDTNRGVSPALSQLEVRIRSFNSTQETIRAYEAEILRHEMAIESANFELKELRANENFDKVRIDALLDKAHDEGFDDAYLERFLKEHHYKLDK